MMRGKHPILWVAVLGLLVLAGCDGGRPQGLTGQQAPDFSLTMLDGSSSRLQDLRGKPVLLEFWAPWCVGCLKNIPALKQMHARFGEKIAIIAASSETGTKTVSGFISEHAIPYPVALSSQKLLNAYRVAAIPVTILIDGQGVVRYHHVGQFPPEVLAAHIQRLL